MIDRPLQLLYRAAKSLAPEAGQVDDAELVRRFATEGDRAAFELLLWRHGPLVWGVCRRTLGHAHDAEDAFQATFLTLARKARAIDSGAAIAGWLYRVALRTALAARAARGLRQRREQAGAELPDRPAGDDPARGARQRELAGVIDEEVARLPECYRLPFILCELQGRCRASAAEELNCAVGTIESRLSRARQRLRARLTRRGLSLPAGLLVASVPGALQAGALRSVLVPDTIAPAVAALADRAARSAVFLSLKGVVLTAVAACLAFVAAGPATSSQPPATLPAENPTTPREKPVEVVATAKEPPLPAEALARVGSARLRHPGMVGTVAFSPDGKLLASVDQNGNARVWDAATGEARHQFNVPASYRPLATFVEDGQTLWVATPAASRDGKASLWSLNLRTGKVSEVHVPGGGTTELFGTGFDPGGTVFGYSPDFKDYYLVETATGKLLAKFTSPTKMLGHNLSIAPGGKLMTFAPDNGAVAIFDPATGQRLLAIADQGQCDGAVFSHDGKTLATIQRDPKEWKHSVTLWDTQTGQPVRRIEGVEPTAGCLTFSPDDKLIAVGTQQRMYVQLFDVATGKEVRRIRSYPSVSQLAFSPDGKALAGCRSLGTVSVWDVATGTPLPASADPEFVHQVRFLPGGQLATIGNRVTIHDYRTGQTVQHIAERRSADFTGWDFTAFAVSPNLKVAAEGDLGNIIRLTDAATGQIRRVLKADTPLYSPLLFSADSRLLFVRGYDETIRIWDVTAGRELHKLSVPGRESGKCLAVSADGRLLATTEGRGPEDQSAICIWDVGQGQKLHRLDGPKGYVSDIAFSPDGTMLAGAGRQAQAAVILWDIATGKVRRTLAVHEGGASVAFSNDGRLLATSGADKTIRLWELASGLERHVFRGHQSGAYSLTFSADSRLLASTSCDAPVFVWDVYELERRDGPAAPAPADRAVLWDALGDTDAAQAFAALRRLAAGRDDSVAFIRANLKPRPGLDADRFDQLLRDLDSDRFAVRQKATAELREVVDDIEPALRKAHSAAASAELRERLAALLAQVGKPSPARLRELRAVEILERLGSVEARKLLEELARGPASAALTKEAAAAWDRLRGR